MALISDKHAHSGIHKESHPSG